MYTINDMIKFFIIILADTGYVFSKEVSPDSRRIIISIKVRNSTVQFTFNVEDGPDDFLEEINIVE